LPCSLLQRKTLVFLLCTLHLLKDSKISAQSAAQSYRFYFIIYLLVIRVHIEIHVNISLLFIYIYYATLNSKKSYLPSVMKFQVWRW
jgi:hypothetical protein